MTALLLLDLFSGIGGFSLGLERSGAFKTVAFCEIEPFCRRVLAKHWPDVPCYDDVRTLNAESLSRDRIAVDAICGGFPCQDLSVAGNGAGIAGERSGLWFEYARLIGELRPKYVIVENVSVLLSRGLDVVLGNLATLGYDAEWHCIPASYVGAHHRRDRIWIVANARIGRCCGSIGGEVEQSGRTEALGTSQAVAYADCERKLQPQGRVGDEWERPGDSGEVLADADRTGHEGSGRGKPPGHAVLAERIASYHRKFAPEPDVGRVADGIPDWSHRIKALGNAVVPQIPELIGRAIRQTMERAA